MKRRSRSILKWGGTVLTVLLLVIWLGSAWWRASVLFTPGAYFLQVQAGRVYIMWDEPLSSPKWRDWSPPERHSQSFSWWFRGWRDTRGGGTSTGVLIPIWVLVVLVAGPTLWLWRCDLRRLPGLCIKCGYDLRGTDHAVCPECGRPVPFQTVS